MTSGLAGDTARLFSARRMISTKQSDAIRNRIRVRVAFHRLYHALKLTDEQISSFEDAAEADWMLINLSAIKSGDKDEDISLSGISRRLELMLNRIVGGDTKMAVQDFVRTSALGQFSDELAIDALSLGVEFSYAQLSEIVRAAADNSTVGPGTLRVPPESVDWDAVFHTVGLTLSDKQKWSMQTTIAAKKFGWNAKSAIGLPIRPPTRGL